MLLKKVALIAFVSVGLAACNNGQPTDENNSQNEETAPQEQMQNEAPGNQQQAPAGMQGQPQSQAPNLSDEELKQFAEIAQEMQIVSQSFQQEMMTAIENEGMQVDRFTQIQQAQQNPNQESDATAEEMQTFDAANQKLQEIQMTAQKEMTQKLEDAGLSQEWYQQTAMAIQSNQELMMRFQQLQQGGNPNQGGAPAQGQ